MASAFKVCTVVIPEDNGYSESPQEVKDRVSKHIRGLEPYAKLKQEEGSVWTLTTPVLGSEIVIVVLERHYGFVVTEKDIMYK